MHTERFAGDIMPPPLPGMVGGAVEPPSPSMLIALALLQRARDAAVDLRVDRWEFAVNLAQLVVAGLSCEDIRQIVADGLAECADERRRTRAATRLFGPAAPSELSARTCFALTPAGERLLKQWNGHYAGEGQFITLLKPRWDAHQRQLRYGDQLVKWYRQPAESQETILAAFEEDGWSRRIDDPLPMADGRCPHERLHEAVKGLNRAQIARLLEFRRDGSGEGVEWAVISR